MDGAPPIQGDGLNVRLDVESEASCKFRITQRELEEVVKVRDPNYERRRNGRAKKMLALDRISIDRAFEEWEKVLKQV